MAIERSNPPKVWLVKDADPLPLGTKQRSMRTGLLAEELVKRGYAVTWFASRFEHARKQFVEGPKVRSLGDQLTACLLDGPGYSRNISLARVRHNRALATDFHNMAGGMPRPDLIVTAFPSPELCVAVCRFAKNSGVPFFVDARDPWPDSFAEYFPKPLRFCISPLVYAYRRSVRECFHSPQGVLAMSRNMLSWALSYAGRPRGVSDGVFYLGYKGQARSSCAKVPPVFSDKATLNLVFIGSFGKSYDVGSIIEAIRLLSPQERAKVRCRLVGKGQYLPRWQKQAAGLDSIIFEGWKDEAGLGDILASSHVGLIPIQGGVTKFWMGNKLFEYASFGVALINSVPNEAASLVEKYQFGVNVGCSDSEGIAHAIKDYLANPALLAAHKNNALDLFEQQFDARNIYSNYADHILKAIPTSQRAVDLQLAV